VTRTLPSWLRTLRLLALLWLYVAGVDRLWLARDRSIPAWDETHHLTGSLNYLHALQQARWLEGDWWRQLWMLSSKNPPLTYILAAPFQQLWGPSPDSATAVNLAFSALLLGCTWALGRYLFGSRTGLWAAAIAAVLPGLYWFRIDYLLDYALAAIVLAGFASLTAWCDAQRLARQWFWALVFGLCCGLGFLTKQSYLFFLAFPLLWVAIALLRQRAWGRLGQAIAGAVVAIALCWPWYSTNWIFFIGTLTGSTNRGAVAEGDPALTSLAAWTYYAEQLPRALTWGLLLVPLVGFALRALARWKLLPPFADATDRESGVGNRDRQAPTLRIRAPLLWLLWFWGGAYAVNSAFFNKDLRYVMPYYAIAALIAARGLLHLPRRWAALRWGTVGLAALLMLLHWFPLAGGRLAPAAQFLSPGPLRYPDPGLNAPHAAIISEIAATAPHLQATLGVLVDTPALNHNNLNYYGALAERQVYGREVGMRDRHVAADARNLDWFLLPEPDALDPNTPRGALAAAIAASPEFQVQGRWQTPDGLVQLYRRRSLPISVEPIANASERPVLRAVEVPESAPAGEPVPVTYTWTGSGAALQTGLVLLTWQAVDGKAYWWQDRAIARGELFNLAGSKAVRVTERTAMLPPADLPPGTYQLRAQYLNPQTGAVQPIQHPTVRLTLVPKAPPLPAPPLDRVTTLRELAKTLPQGRVALDPVFDTVGQINQYDPTQDYVRQAEATLRYRLEQTPDDLEAAYGFAFAQILQEDAPEATAALERVARLDAQNPWAHAYLTFIHLYRWQPRQARAALQPALELAPELPELQLLDGATAILELNWLKAWRVLKPLLESGELED